jgi:hypothetical protein
MSVSEYRDKFIQLSRYAPREVDDDEKKQELFLEGLIGPLQYQLISHNFHPSRDYSTKQLLWKTRGLSLEKRGKLLTRDKMEVVHVPVILLLKVHLLVAVPSNKLNRPNQLLLKQGLQLYLLLLIHPQIGHASSVGRLDTMPTTIPIGLLILLWL